MTYIKPDAVFVSCDPRDSIRIRVTAYTPGDARAQVVDAATGKRPRQVLVSGLHKSPYTTRGTRRRTGYALEGSDQQAPPAAPQRSSSRRLTGSTRCRTYRARCLAAASPCPCRPDFSC